MPPFWNMAGIMEMFRWLTGGKPAGAESRRFSIEIQPEFTPARVAAIRESLDHFLASNRDVVAPGRDTAIADLIIKCFAFRNDELAAVLEREEGFSRVVALRLAAIAGRRAVAAYGRAQALEIGSRRYRWSTSHDERVCARCAAMEGKVFYNDTRPEHGHPGECECWRFLSPNYETNQVGRRDDRCPNCAAELRRRPKGKSLCPHCRQPIWVRKDGGGAALLLNAAMLGDYMRRTKGPEVCRCVAVPLLDM